MNSNTNSFSITGFLKSSSLPALYIKMALVALPLYFLADKLIYNAPFPQYSYNTVLNASSMAASLGIENDSTYDATFKQGYMRTEFADIKLPGHALPVLELVILIPLLLLWPAHWLARLLSCAAAVIGVYYLNSLRIAILLYADHFYPAYFPWMNKYFVPLGYMLLLLIFFLVYAMVFGRLKRQ